MATPNTTFTSGQILTATQVNNLAWGSVGFVNRTAGDLTIAGGAQDLTGMSITFTAVANRIYRASWLVNGNKAAVDRDGTFIQFTDSANTVIASVNMQTDSGAQGINFSSNYTFTTAAGSKTYKLRMGSFSGNLTVFANSTNPISFLIEDIGSQ